MSEEGPARRGRPRVGDATQARIEEIADGWGKPAKAKPPAPRPAGPPPPPGSSSGRTPLPRPPRSKPSSVPPPVPAQRSERKSRPPPPPKGRPAARIPEKPPPEPEAEPERTAEPEPESLPEPELPAADSAPAPTDIYDDDEDPTIVPTGDEPAAETSLRTPGSLPRKRGIWGDMRYVFTVVFGLRRVKVELAETEAEIEAEKRSRDGQLAELARLAIADERVTAPAVERAREKLVELEEARSKKAGAAAAVEEAIGALQRERDQKASVRTERVADLEAEVERLTGVIEPLEKERARVNRAIRRFTAKVDDYDSRIETEEAKLESDDTAVAVEAEAAIASLRAERETLSEEEPELARQLAEIEPRLRELKAKRGGLNKEINKLRRAEDESVVRSEERIAAARAHKQVVDRAAADMSREQDEMFTELGQAIYERPPPEITRMTLPIKEQVITLARLKDRATALAEERASVEAFPLFRGVALWLLLAAILGAGAYLALTWS